jgi:hypothetical protein
MDSSGLAKSGLGSSVMISSYRLRPGLATGKHG